MTKEIDYLRHYLDSVVLEINARFPSFHAKLSKAASIPQLIIREKR
jgi:hypothetical protein